MDWKHIENILAIILPALFFLFKDFVPYCNARYHIFRFASSNKEIVKDLNKNLLISIIHLPCEMIEISAGYLVGQVLFFTQAASAVPENPSDLQTLAPTLPIITVLLCATIFIIFPLWVTLTNISGQLIYGSKGSKKNKSIGISLCVLIYFLSIAYVLFCLKRS